MKDALKAQKEKNNSVQFYFNLKTNFDRAHLNALFNLSLLYCIL